MIDISPGALGDNTARHERRHGPRRQPGDRPAVRAERRPRATSARAGRVLGRRPAVGDAAGPLERRSRTRSSRRARPESRIGGAGPSVDRLEWDVKLYLALNGAVHDAAIAAWGLKGKYDSVRPISMIRYMGGLGQSSDPIGPSYDPEGLPLEPGLIEVITPRRPRPAQRHAALAGARGRDRDPRLARATRPTRRRETSGVRLDLRGRVDPVPAPTFVTPAFPGYTSGHSTFSRAAAEVMTALHRAARTSRAASASYDDQGAASSSSSGVRRVDVTLAVGDVLRRGRPGRPVAAVRRHPHLCRRLQRPDHRLAVRQGRVGPRPALLRRQAGREVPPVALNRRSLRRDAG